MIITFFTVEKIKAIKAVRMAFGCGLKEAKDIVEAGPVRITTTQYYALKYCFGSAGQDADSILQEFNATTIYDATDV